MQLAARAGDKTGQSGLGLRIFVLVLDESAFENAKLPYVLEEDLLAGDLATGIKCWLSILWFSQIKRCAGVLYSKVRSTAENDPDFVS